MNLDALYCVSFICIYFVGEYLRVFMLRWPYCYCLFVNCLEMGKKLSCFKCFSFGELIEELLDEHFWACCNGSWDIIRFK